MLYKLQNITLRIHSHLNGLQKLGNVVLHGPTIPASQIAISAFDDVQYNHSMKKEISLYDCKILMWPLKR